MVGSRRWQATTSTYERRSEKENEKMFKRTSARLTNRDDPLKHRCFLDYIAEAVKRVVTMNLCVNLASKKSLNLESPNQPSSQESNASLWVVEFLAIL